VGRHRRAEVAEELPGRARFIPVGRLDVAAGAPQPRSRRRRHPTAAAPGMAQREQEPREQGPGPLAGRAGPRPAAAVSPSRLPSAPRGGRRHSARQPCRPLAPGSVEGALSRGRGAAPRRRLPLRLRRRSAPRAPSSAGPGGDGPAACRAPERREPRLGRRRRGEHAARVRARAPPFPGGKRFPGAGTATGPGEGGGEAGKDGPRVRHVT
jgi:hypothetical protein